MNSNPIKFMSKFKENGTLSFAVHIVMGQDCENNDISINLIHGGIEFQKFYLF